MSLDLEQLYASMGERADRVVLAPMESLRGRARHVRAVLIAGAAVPVMAVLTTVALALTILAPSSPQTDVGQGFLTFDGAAAPVLRYGVQVTDASTVVHGDTVFAQWVDIGNQEYVAAIDLGQLRPLWGPVRVGRFVGVHQLWVSRGAVLAAAASQGSSAEQGSSNDQLVALDPANGNVMWRLDFDFEFDQMLLYDDIAIVSLTESRDVAAVDLRTGGMRWASGWNLRPLGITAIRDSGEFAELGGFGSLPAPADHRFVTRHADGRIEVRNGDNGELLGEFPGGTDEVAPAVAFNGMLYSADANGVTQLDLGQGQPRTVYTGEVHRLNPCGTSLLCILGEELVVIDTASGRELWRAPAQWSRGDVSATPLALRVPVIDGGYVVYDPVGKRLLTLDGAAHWADEEHLLVWESSGAVSVYVAHTGKRAILGRAAWAACSWTRTMLACPTEHGISVWRYRAGR